MSMERRDDADFIIPKFHIDFLSELVGVTAGEIKFSGTVAGLILNLFDKLFYEITELIILLFILRKTTKELEMRNGFHAICYNSEENAAPKKPNIHIVNSKQSHQYLLVHLQLYLRVSNYDITFDLQINF